MQGCNIRKEVSIYNVPLFRPEAPSDRTKADVTVFPLFCCRFKVLLLAGEGGILIEML